MDLQALFADDYGQASTRKKSRSALNLIDSASPVSQSQGTEIDTAALVSKSSMVSRTDVVALFDRLLESQPDLKDAAFVTKAGFTYRAQVLLEGKLKGRSISSESIAGIFFLSVFQSLKATGLPM